MTDTNPVTLLDGLPPGPTSTILQQALAAAGVRGPAHMLTEERIVPCQGCWKCWLEAPGTCKTKDAANDVMRDIIGARAVLWTTRLSFGSWSSPSKAALDRSLGLLSPFFEQVQGETHHRARYGRYPRHGVVAVVGPESTARERETFARLVARNVLNMHGDVSWVGFVPESPDPRLARAVVQEGLQYLGKDPPDEMARVPPFRSSSFPVGVPRRAGARHAALWVGSAKPRGTSTSEALGGLLLRELAARGWTTETVHAAHALRLGRAAEPRLVKAVRRADLLVLAAPVYWDALPALVVHGLEVLAKTHLGPARPALLPIVQCGFPELEHTRLALDVASLAADEIGLGWAGHLAMAGGGMIDGRPLERSPHRFAHQIAALVAAAEALDEGDPVPARATLGFAHLSIPKGLYNVIGQVGWAASALRSGHLFELGRRPFREVEAPVARPRA